MKSKQILPVYFLVFLPFIIFAQINPPIEFEDYTPVWQHIIIDSSSISSQSDGMDVFFQTHFLLDETGLYAICSYSEYGNGAFLEKINTITGDQLWSNFFDERNNDKYEYLDSYYFNGDNIELLCLRDKKNNPVFNKENKFSRWEFDKKSGEVNEHHYASFQDTTSPVLIYNFANNGILQRLNENRYYYIPRKSEYIQECDSCDILIYLLNKYGKLLSTSKIYNLPKEREDIIKRINFAKKISDDTVLLFQKNLLAFDDTSKRNYYINFVDSSFNLIHSKKLEGIDYIQNKYSGAEFGYADEKHIFIIGNDEENIESDLYIYDGQANFKKKYDIVTPDGQDMVSVKIIKLQDGSFLLAGTTFSREKDKDYYLVFYKLDENLSLHFLKKFKVVPKDNYLYTRNLAQLSNGDILLSGRHQYNKFTPDGKFWSVKGYWETWLYFKAEDIGLTTATKDVPVGYNIKIFPNPNHGKFTISIPSIKEQELIISNIYGQKVYYKKGVDNDITINLNYLPPGIYFATLKSNKGIISRKFEISR